MIRDLAVLLIGILIGIIVSENKENEKHIKKVVTFFSGHFKDYSEDFKKLILKTIENLELKDTDEIKLNFEKFYSLLKERLNDLLELEIDNKKNKDNLNKKKVTKNDDDDEN